MKMTPNCDICHLRFSAWLPSLQRYSQIGLLIFSTSLVIMQRQIRAHLPLPTLHKPHHISFLVCFLSPLSNLTQISWTASSFSLFKDSKMVNVFVLILNKIRQYCG